MILHAAEPELVSAAEYLFEIGELTDTVALLRFFERPARYPALVSLWEHERIEQGELQDERRATL